MQKKQMLFKTKGMNRDLSVSAFNPEFAFENINLRLSTNENNTLLSWVNEKGTEKINLKCNMNTVENPIYVDLPIVGTPIGTAVINHKLVIFTTEDKDRLYVVRKECNIFTNTCIFEGNLKFNIEYPLETLVSYESDNVEKVYWTDNLNQPRVANIAKLFNNHISDTSGEVYTKFDFVISAKLDSTLTVNKRTSGGMFAPGVIQYCYTYFNKYEQQSNIINVSPLYYLTHSERGASAEDKVDNSFEITISNPDESFDRIRLYSIHRTSLDATPHVLALEDFPVTPNTTITYVDNGSNGATVDPMEMLFIGGKEILAYTMEEKDQTLFLGNITQVNSDISDVQRYFDKIRNENNRINIEFVNGVKVKDIPATDWEYIPNNPKYGSIIITGIQGYDNIEQAFLDNKPLNVFYNNNGLIYIGFYGTQEDIPSGDTVITIIGTEINEEKYNVLKDSTGSLYDNTFTLNNSRRKVTTFKGGDYYRFGFQLQKNTGEWTEPIFIDDAQNDKYPRTSIFDERVNLVHAEAEVSLSVFIDSTSPYYIKDFNKVYKRIRPIIVYPDINDRVTLCQGVLNPTVFNVEDRKEGIPYAQASWNFRPYSICKQAQKENDNKVEFLRRGDEAEAPSDPNGYTVMMLRVKASEAGYYFKEKCIDFQHNDKGEGKYPYYTALVFNIINIKNKSDDVNLTECWDILFWMPKVRGSMSIIEYERLIRADMSSASEYYGQPDNKMYRLWFWTGFDENNVRRYALPDGVVADDFCRLLRYTGSEENVYFNVSFRKCDFKYKDESLIYQLFIDARLHYGDYTISLYKEKGNVAVFNHYASLYSMSDIDTVNVFDGTSTSKIYYLPTCNRLKEVEIQNSVTKYDTPFDLTINEDAENTNTQFFVDQSIVTLNSPDLEFDTIVQNYPTDNLKLRIIGVLPITANASSHKITTSSSMIPLDYQTEEDDNGYIKEAKDFGRGELDINTYYLNKNIDAGYRMIAEYMWEDAWIDVKADKAVSSYPEAAHYLIYPWQVARSLTNDSRGNSSASSVLKTKISSQLLYSCNTAYFATHSIYKCTVSGNTTPIKLYDFGKTETCVHLQNNEFIENLRLSKQVQDSPLNVNYYANVDKSLVNDRKWRTHARGYFSNANKQGAVLMRYKSGTHAVMSLPAYSVGDNKVNILPYAVYDSNGDTIYAGKYEGTGGKTFWGDRIAFNQEGIDIRSSLIDRSLALNNSKPYATLWLAELYKDVDPSYIFGGKGIQAVQANRWLVGGEAQSIDTESPMTLKWTEGDTFYQRYDCLKTYPYSDQDSNQMVEIFSFMCESHVNLDGRWDRNRGQRDNTMISPVNFNLMNPVYNQKDNFFNYKKTEDDKVFKFPNLITFTKTKESGAEIDQWTNITLSSNLELDGSKGEIRSIQRLNNQLFTFQDSGISQILYNETVQIASTEGVPIEIANSQKVQGKRYYSNSIGCSNKYSICNTPSGIYFIDSNDKGIYLFNGELNNLSNKFGFNTWCKTNIYSNKKWNPVSFEDFVTYYDRQNQDVLFINKEHCLAFSEKLGAFTSFYSYENTPYFCSLDEDGLWWKGKDLWLHRGGDYCKFFGNYKPFSTTLVGNPEPQVDKIFTNLEFRASIDGEGIDEGINHKPFLPFDKLEAWNEYQKGYTNLKDKDGHSPYKHHDGDDSTLLRKFRIWRCDIPRDNDNNGRKAHPMDRMRNPWLYLKLEKKNDTSKRTEIHDVVMTYFD